MDQHQFWNEFLASRGDQGGNQSRLSLYETFFFADSEAAANELGALVLAGKKRATSELMWWLDHLGKRPPRAGDLSLVTNWTGEPLCIIETVRVEVVAFERVSMEFAAAEGEGDCSLEDWRCEHWAYFGRECEAMGRVPCGAMPIVCEQFKVVYR